MNHQTSVKQRFFVLFWFFCFWGNVIRQLSYWAVIIVIIWIFVVNLHILPTMICMLSAWLSRFLFVLSSLLFWQQWRTKKTPKPIWWWVRWLYRTKRLSVRETFNASAQWVHCKLNLYRHKLSVLNFFLFWKIKSSVGGIHLPKKCFVKLAFYNGFSSHFWRKKNLILRYWELFNKRLLHLGIEKGAPFIWKCIHVSFKYTRVYIRPTLTDSFTQEAEKNSPDQQQKERKKKPELDAPKLLNPTTPKNTLVDLWSPYLSRQTTVHV